MTAALGGLLVVAVLLLVRQHLAWRASNMRHERLQTELRHMAGLTDTLSGGDWGRSVEGLASHLVSAGVCRSAVLLGLAENGSLEHRASAHATGEPEWDAAGEPEAQQALEHLQPVTGDEGGIYLPVVEDGEAIGLLAMRNAHTDSPLVPVAVRLAALGLTGMRLYQKQSVLSNTDGLTGLANHRHFQQMLSVALAQSYLENEPLSMILMDIDHFKTVNDTYGHLFGDLVLRELAYLLRRELPADATAARYGGEEFVLLLRGADAVRAGELADQLRTAISRHQIFDFSSGSPLSVTVSLGVAFYELGQGKSRLVARADEALYTSKHEGRNRVTIARAENSTSHLFPS